VERSELSYTELDSIVTAVRGVEGGLNTSAMAFRSARPRGRWPWKDILHVWLGIPSWAIQTAATKQENHRHGFECESMPLRVIGMMEFLAELGDISCPVPRTYVTRTFLNSIFCV
jgi:hypothetical protein